MEETHVINEWQLPVKDDVRPKGEPGERKASSWDQLSDSSSLMRGEGSAVQLLRFCLTNSRGRSLSASELWGSCLPLCRNHILENDTKCFDFCEKQHHPNERTTGNALEVDQRMLRGGLSGEFDEDEGSDSSVRTFLCFCLLVLHGVRLKRFLWEFEIMILSCGGFSGLALILWFSGHMKEVSVLWSPVLHQQHLIPGGSEDR